MKKIIISIIGIILGILFFKTGHVLLENMADKKEVKFNSEQFWEEPITIKGGEELEITPNFLFHTIPPMETYPENKIVYFKYVTTKEVGSKIIITSEIIQNRITLFKNRFYFEKGKKTILKKVINEDMLTGEVNDIKDADEIKSLLSIYSDFINLYE